MGNVEHSLLMYIVPLALAVANLMHYYGWDGGNSQYLQKENHSSCRHVIKIPSISFIIHIVASQAPRQGEGRLWTLDLCWRRWYENRCPMQSSKSRECQILHACFTQFWKCPTDILVAMNWWSLAHLHCMVFMKFDIYDNWINPLVLLQQFRVDPSKLRF